MAMGRRRAGLNDDDVNVKGGEGETALELAPYSSGQLCVEDLPITCMMLSEVTFENV